MSKRQEWTFNYAVGELLAAVGNKLAYHADRLNHWQGRLAAAQEDLKENGIDFREVAKKNSITNSGYYNQPQFDPVKLDVLQEAQGKVDHHEGLLTQYRRYERAFQHAGDGARYDLHTDDLEFFGL